MFEILGDLGLFPKQANQFSQSKSLGLYSNFMERLVNAGIQASKKLKQIQR
jgi:glutamyl-tRNA reductase